MKECGKCKVHKTLNDFYRHGPSKDGFRNICKECSILYRNTVGKERQLKNRYGISINQYNDLFNKQSGNCAICGVHQSELKISLAVDHCHKTGEIRGLLCGNCNRGIGYLKDDQRNIEKALDYLKRFNDKQYTHLSCPL